ncbi:MAG: associated Golgi protein [Verrucomicrobia bacterium]|nr:associated Golgi protein [Verrucomicrobiota bacterium]
MNRRGKINLAKLAVILALLAVIGWWAVRQMDLSGVVDRSVAFFREAGPWPFFGAMALLPLLGFPISPFTLAAGPVFAPVLGLERVILFALLAVVANVALSYWIAARALRPLVMRIVKSFGHTLPEIQPNATWPVILLIRIVPGPPFFLQNYLLGLARVPFGIYMLVSTVVPAAYLAAVIVFGDAFMRGDRRAMIGAGLIFLVAGAILHLTRRFLARKKKGTERAGRGKDE